MSAEATPSERIQDLDAGSLLDALVAEHVLGWRWVHCSVASFEYATWVGFLVRPEDVDRYLADPMARFLLGPGKDQSHAAVPPFSTRLEDAWRVVEWLRQRGFVVRVQEMPDGFPWLLDQEDPRARVFRKALVILHPVTEELRRRRWMWQMQAFGDTSPLAICRAGLVAVERLGREEGKAE